MVRSLGLQPVQVWSDKDLLPGWSGSLSGEAASGPAERSLCDPAETRPRVEQEEEVPAHERGGHHPATVHPGNKDNPVRGLQLFLPACPVVYVRFMT